MRKLFRTFPWMLFLCCPGVQSAFAATLDNAFLPALRNAETEPVTRPRDRLKVRFTELNAAVFGEMSHTGKPPPFQFLLNLSDEKYLVTVQTAGVNFSGGVTWHGTIEGVEDSLILFTSVGKAISGAIFVRGKMEYEIQSRSKGMVEIFKIDPTNQRHCGGVADSNLTRMNGGPLSLFSLSSRRSLPPSDKRVSPILIDVLVVYTPDARQGAGGDAEIRSLIELSVAHANLAFENSKISVQLRLVHASEVAYSESGNLETDIKRLQSKDDGFMDEIHNLRDLYSADLVCLFTETADGNEGGRAFLMTGVSPNFESDAFSVVRRDSAIGSLAFAHEIGHNLGCNHDRDNALGTGAFAYSYGHRFAAEGKVYRTIMAYEPGESIPYFSNPDVLFKGVPTGVPDGSNAAADNAKTINITAAIASRFRTDSIDPSFMPLVDGEVQWIVPQDDNRILIAGNFTAVDQTNRAGVALLNANGGLDVSFQPRIQISGDVRYVGFTESGKLIVHALLGSIGAIPLSDLARLNSDGTLDNTFPDIGATSAIEFARVLPRDQLLLAGIFFGLGKFDIVLLRFNGNGTVDQGFSAPSGLHPHAAAVSSDSKLILSVDNKQRLLDCDILRLNKDGSVDSSFRSGVMADGFVNSVAVQADGRVLIAGGFRAVNGVSRTGLAKLNQDGSLDATFNPGFDRFANITAMTLLSDGKILVGGRLNSTAVSVVRLNSDGTLDTQLQVDFGDNGLIQSIAAQSDGKVLVGGKFDKVDNLQRDNLVRIKRNQIEPRLFKSITRLANGEVELLLDGAAGNRFDIFTSTGLSNWSSWTNLISSGKNMMLIDATATTGSKRFYKGVITP